jgi:hypothetical protein
MKTTKRYLVKSEKIHSLKDIEMEKQRLRLEILKTEANIHAEYHSILNALTFKNIASNVIGNISPASTIISKAVSFGKSLMEKRRKKKHREKDEGHRAKDE